MSDDYSLLRQDEAHPESKSNSASPAPTGYGEYNPQNSETSLLLSPIPGRKRIRCDSDLKDCSQPPEKMYKGREDHIDPDPTIEGLVCSANFFSSNFTNPKVNFQRYRPITKRFLNCLLGLNPRGSGTTSSTSRTEVVYFWLRILSSMQVMFVISVP